jgi:hypothetical protein
MEEEDISTRVEDVSVKKEQINSVSEVDPTKKIDTAEDLNFA